MSVQRKYRLMTAGVAALACLCSGPLRAELRIIEIVADHDSRYRMLGVSKPAITAFPGEDLLLRITARKASTMNRDGSIHGFTLLRSKDRSRVSGWDFLLKPGTQEIAARAPMEPGDYEVVCTVICSQDHEGMHMKFTVLAIGSEPVVGTDGVSTNLVLSPVQSFAGEIADTQCALNVHSLTSSHQEMIKAKQMGPDAPSCARYCVRHMGGSFVLMSKKTVYRLDDQVKAEAFAGQKVHVSGSLDSTTNTIHLVDVAAE